MLHFRTLTTVLAVVIFVAGCSPEVPAVVEATDPAPALSAEPITDGLTAHRPAVPGVHGLISPNHAGRRFHDCWACHNQSVHRPKGHYRSHLR